MVVTKPELISLDVWNTLIESNPQYAKKRNEYLSEEFSLPIDIIKAAYYKVKNDSDKMAEERGKCLSNMQIYKTFLFLLGKEDYNWLKLRSNLEQLFAEYQPYVLPRTVEYLKLLNDQGVELSIASNTNFIRGKILHDVMLSKWGIDWKFQVFSDQVKKPKPHLQFWRTVIRRAYKYVKVIPREILHIGDNRICDGSCIQSNIQFQHINGPTALVKTLESVYNE